MVKKERLNRVFFNSYCYGIIYLGDIVRKLLIFLIVIVLIYAIFITEECFRLKNDGEYPLITLDSKYCNKNGGFEYTETGYKIDCKGLGYNVKREYAPKEENSDVYYVISS